ncbi:MAG: hypothetical protein DRO88_13540 [Promethearchaeia archaeon]|nr:MAG: hypothetical protein DRO88_13540 [Candidatus Lokiarchaeia archaeon]
MSLWLNRQTTDILELPATGIKPAGGTKAAVPDELGIASVLKFVNNSENCASMAFSLPPHCNFSRDMNVLIGWATASTSGDCRWGLSYKWAAAGTNINSSADGEEISLFATNDGSYEYNRSVFTLPAPPNQEPVCIIMLTRYGNHVDDTINDSVFLVGVLLNYILK